MSTKDRAAEALAPMLSSFGPLNDRFLHGVWHDCTEGSLDKLVLDFGQLSLLVEADENDDSIGFVVAEITDRRCIGGVDAGGLEPWSRFIGKPFGWGWVTVNQQGYCDGLLLSFGGIVPQIILNVIASSIKVGTISPAPR